MDEFKEKLEFYLRQNQEDPEEVQRVLDERDVDRLINFWEIIPETDEETKSMLREMIMESFPQEYEFGDS
jgi:hypothetical protein